MSVQEQIKRLGFKPGTRLNIFCSRDSCSGSLQVFSDNLDKIEIEKYLNKHPGHNCYFGFPDGRRWKIENDGIEPDRPLQPTSELPSIESDNLIRGANPQAEDGHIDIANEIAEVLARINFYPYESRILWVIWRKTYGWHKKVDRISFTQFEKSTGLHRRHIQRTLKHLEERKIIVASKGYGKNATYGFQKDYTKWKDVAYKGYDDGKIRFNKQARIDRSLPTEAILPIEATDRSLQRLTQKKLIKENIYVEGSDELRLATLLLKEIQRNKAERNLSPFKQPNLQRWAREIDLMIRKDGRKPERIQEVILWCQRSSFWWKNILSTGKLKDQFERLEAEMEEKKTSFKTERPQVEYKDFTGAGQR